MTLGFTPSIELYGANAARLNERLISWTHIDAAGIESDQLTLTLDIEGLEGLPELGGKVGLRVGYLESGLVDRGEFIITRRTPNLFPPRLTLVATAAPFKVADATGFKQRRSASHGPTTLGALFRQLTSRHGFSPPGGARTGLDTCPACRSVQRDRHEFLDAHCAAARCRHQAAQRDVCAGAARAGEVALGENPFTGALERHPG